MIPGAGAGLREERIGHEKQSGPDADAEPDGKRMLAKRLHRQCKDGEHGGQCTSRGKKPRRQQEVTRMFEQQAIDEHEVRRMEVGIIAIRKQRSPGQQCPAGDELMFVMIQRLTEDKQ